jgi:Leucine-rich repeat (LRR) protein
MKKLTTFVLFTLLSVSCAWADVAINATNFPDANFRKFLLSIDVGKDGVLTSDFELKLNRLDVEGENIRNLKGLEFFGSLKILNCEYIGLTSLDISKNKQLQILNCSGNQLTSLDVSKNTKLTHLDCYWNKLTSLDVSKNTALESLNCGGNKLTSLNVSKNTKLKKLDCDSSIKVTGWPK